MIFFLKLRFHVRFRIPLDLVIKFIIVREHMERLVSAFNDLFIVSDRKGLQREALKVRGVRNRKITFNDFIKAVVLPQDSVGNFNSDM